LNTAKTASILWGIERSEKQPQSYGGIPQQGTLAELLWDFVG
jgi:hypothetical protein